MSTAHLLAANRVAVENAVSVRALDGCAVLKEPDVAVDVEGVVVGVGDGGVGGEDG